MQKVTKEQFANNAIWRFLELTIRKIIGLIISTILARLLIPDAYGIVALTTVFITFSDIFILNGFNIALIRKKHITEDDYSTVMILSLLFTAIIYVCIFSCAPIIASFYDIPELKNVLRAVTILLFFQSVAAVLRAKGTRELRFKEMSIVTVIENVIAGLIGIIMAYTGFGVWALIAQQVFATFLDMVLLSITFHWTFKFSFQIQTVRETLRFTTAVMGASFMDFLGNNANSLIIGKIYSSKELGYMNRGIMYPDVIGINVYSAINSVLLPTLASRQHDKIALHSTIRQIVSMTEYVLFPLMLGFAGMSRNFIIVLLTDKWIQCLSIMVCSCINNVLNPIRAIGYNVFYAIGNSQVSLKIELFRVAFMLINVFITIILFHRSIYTLAFSNMIIAFFVVLLTHRFLRKTINYAFKELIIDVLPPILLSVPMLLVIIVIDRFIKNSIIALFLQMFLGTSVYILFSALTNNNNFIKIKKIILERI